jgi:hypothetical protein
MTRKVKKQKKNSLNKTIILLCVFFLFALVCFLYFTVPLKTQFYYLKVFLSHMQQCLYYLSYLKNYDNDKGYYFACGIISLLFYMFFIVPRFVILSKNIFAKDCHSAKTDITMTVIYFICSILCFTLIIYSLSGIFDDFIKFEHQSYIFIDILYFVASCITGNNNDIVPLTSCAKLCLIFINLLIYFHLTLGGIIIFKVLDKKH